MNAFLQDSDLLNDQPLSGLSFYLKVFGCQMNEHDAERIAGNLEALGAQEAGQLEDSDIVIFLTCCVREAADIRLLGQVASMKNTPAPHGHRIVAIGGCIGQRDGSSLLDQFAHVDIVFGTMNIHELPSMIIHVLEGQGRVSETVDESDLFASDLPCKRRDAFHAWISIMTGCNNFCTYCIVPYVRGREHSRLFDDVVAEARSFVEQGVREITLLGQNVNSYGTDLYGAPRFAEILETVAGTGIDRLRFATSHPKDIDERTMEAFASVPAVMPYLHLPIQSGSDRILEKMNRNYTASDYLSKVERLRNLVPDIALSTDIIVGFPGETEEDFQATLNLVKEVGYSQAFTFIYSKRAGTPAAEMPDDTSSEEIQERFDRLVAAVQESAYDCNQKDLGAQLPVLFQGPSKRDVSVLTGRSPKYQTVHIPLPDHAKMDDYVGKIGTVSIDKAKTWYLEGHLTDGELH